MLRVKPKESLPTRDETAATEPDVRRKFALSPSARHVNGHGQNLLAAPFRVMCEWKSHRSIAEICMRSFFTDHRCDGVGQPKVIAPFVEI
jgi:hypothetical protein